jgi:hypothetical protein
MVEPGGEIKMLQQVVAPKRSWLSKSLPMIGFGLCSALVAAGIVLYFVNPLPAAVSSAPTTKPTPWIAYPIAPIPAPPPSIASATRAALLSVGVDKDKAADLSAAIEQSITKQTDEKWFYGKIAVGSLMPLWIIALVALFRHQRPPVDLSRLEAIVRRAEWLAMEAERR